MNGAELLDYIEGLKKYRIEYEPRWYNSINAYENNHFVGWSRQRGSLVKVPFRKRFFIQLPETKKQADSFENLLLLSNPMFVMYPNDFSNPKDVKEARALSMLLRQKYLDWDAENVLHSWVHNAIVMPVSFLEIAIEDEWDADKGRTVKTIKPRVGDAFDWLFDPHYQFEDNPIIVKILRNPYQHYKNSSLYKMPKNGMARDSVRDFKEVYMSDKYGSRQGNDDLETVTAYECQIKEKDGLRIRTIDMNGEEIRNDFYKDITFYPVVPLQLFSGNIYQPSHLENLIPINRAMDLLANRIEDFLLKFVKGWYIVRDGTDLVFSDENGSVVKYSGEKPEMPPIPNLPPAILQFFNTLMSLSERYGVNQIAMGLTPRGSQNRSAKQGEQSMKAAMNQQKTPVDNLFFAMKRLAEVTIYFLSILTDEPVQETLNNAHQQDGEDFTTMKFIGEQYKDLYPDAVPIPQKVKKMSVEMQDSQTYTIEAKRESALQLAQVFDKIPEPLKKPILNLYRIGNTDDIMSQFELDNTLLANPDIKMLIAHQKFLPPEVQQGLSLVLAYMAKNQGAQTDGGKPFVQPPSEPPPQNPGQSPPQPPPQQPQQPQQPK